MKAATTLPDALLNVTLVGQMNGLSVIPLLGTPFRLSVQTKSRKLGRVDKREDDGRDERNSEPPDQHIIVRRSGAEKTCRGPANADAIAS